MIEISKRPPVWKHDCKACEYLGGYDIGPRLYDLYICRSDKLDVVISRVSSEPSDYYSMDVDDRLLHHSKGMYVQLLIAAALGKARPPR